jgi:response regulator RpfG family c-di-GMP phosphodiesterase
MKNLLIVDDEIEIANSLKEYLSEKGFNVHTCTAADEAYSFFEKEHTDLILSDIKMPGKSGIELFSQCTLLHENQKTKTPFVLMTSYTDIIGVEKAFSMGVSELIAKPFDLESLNLVINYLLNLDKSIGSIEDKYFAINIEEFIHSSSNCFDIYLQIAGRYVLVTKSGQEFSEQRLHNYARKGVQHIYLNSNDFARYADLQFAIAKSLNKRPLDVVRKTKLMKHLTESVGKTVLLKGIDKNNLKNALIAFESYMQVALNNSQLTSVLDQLLNTSPSVVERSSARAILSTMVTGLWKWTSPKHQSRLILSALMCDISLKDHPDLLAKKLYEYSTLEKHQYEQHPVESYKILSQIPDLPEEIPTVAIQHHENSAGLGFPQRIPRNKLHSYSVIVHCIDEFLETLVSSKNPEDIKSALDTLVKNQGKMINLQVVKSLYLIFNKPMPREIEALLLPQQTSRLN